MAGDLSHFLLPNSRLPKDVSFLVSGKEVAAHKSLLASQHQIFDKMFFEDEAGSATTTVKVCPSEPSADSEFLSFFVLYSRLFADFLSLGKWVKLVKFEAENEFFLHLEG